MTRRRRNAIIGLIDAPPWGDWVFWNLVIWVLFAAIGVAAPAPEDSTTTTNSWWVNLLVGLFFIVVFGLVPGLVRRGRRTRATEHLLNQQTDPHLVRPIIHPIADPAPGPPPAPPPVSGIRPVVVPAMPTELSAVRSRFPYPIADAARTLQFNSEPISSYNYLLDLADVLITCLGCVVAAVCRRETQQPPAMYALHEAYLTRGVSLGHWLAVAKIARSEPALASQVPGLAEAMQRRKGGGGLPEQLDLLVQERNRAAHGGRPQTRADAVERIGRLLPTLASAMGLADFLSASEWSLVKDNDYRRASGVFHVTAQRAMGEHPNFGLTEFDSAQPLEDDVMYLRLPAGNVELSPFIVVRECATCRRSEMFHSDRLTKAGAALKAFGSGHDLRDPALDTELRTLTTSLPT